MNHAPLATVADTVGLRPTSRTSGRSYCLLAVGRAAKRNSDAMATGIGFVILFAFKSLSTPAAAPKPQINSKLYWCSMLPWCSSQRLVD